MSLVHLKRHSEIHIERDRYRRALQAIYESNGTGAWTLARDALFLSTKGLEAPVASGYANRISHQPKEKRMSAPLWTQSVTTDDQGKKTYSPLDAAQVSMVYRAITEFLATGEYTSSIFDVSDDDGHTLTTATAQDTTEAAVGRLLSAADEHNPPLPITSNTPASEIAEIAKECGTPQWS